MVDEVLLKFQCLSYKPLYLCMRSIAIVFFCIYWFYLFLYVFQFSNRALTSLASRMDHQALLMSTQINRNKGKFICQTVN